MPITRLFKFTKERICSPSLLILTATLASVFAQPTPGTDVLIFVNGEKLIGHLKTATDTRVVFISNMAGEITVPWAKVQELHTSERFAVIPKEIQQRSKEGDRLVTQGSLEMSNQKLQVTAAQTPAKTIPLNDVLNVVAGKAFDASYHRPSIWEGWIGGATVGIGLVQSTQNVRNLNTNLNLTRAIPTENWLRTRYRTTIDFNSTYGKISQADTPTVKTELYHADAEQDYNISHRTFVLAGASWDHNFAQGLDLMQSYGGGLGYEAFKNENSSLEVRAGVGFTNQQFTDEDSSHKLLTSKFQTTYSHRFARGITFNGQVGARPAWNNSKAFTGGFLMAINAPVYRRLSMSITSFDSYVNDPPPGFKKNTLNINFGATYTFK